jgi:hypothetical protein
MKFLRKNFPLLIALAVTAACIVFSNRVQKRPCDVPIEYKIGTIDPRFGITESSFQNDIAEAGRVWGATIHRQLFKYNPDGELTINLVYDWRQQTTQDEGELKSNMTQLTASAGSIKRQITSLRETLQASKQEYEDQTAQYNGQVEHWNNSGGAPNDVHASLNDELAALEQKRRDLNEQNNQINALINQYNMMIGNINARARVINNDGLAGTEFRKGVYAVKGDFKHIDIYQFREQSDLLLVLVHELGHALGLQHNGNSNSIMSPLLGSAGVDLSPEDLKDLRALCSL